MNHQFTSEDRECICNAIQQKYTKVAISPEGNFRYPTGHAGLEAQKYNHEFLKVLPEDILSSYCGVGNPFSLGAINEGEVVLDIGCGAGVDSIIAAMMVGPTGRVVGIDMVSEMLEKAKQNLSQISLNNIEFHEYSDESLPFPDKSFEVVISNGVFNLIPDKLKALSEVYRVLKTNGKIMVADQILTDDSPSDTKSMVDKWAG